MDQDKDLKHTNDYKSLLETLETQRKGGTGHFPLLPRSSVLQRFWFPLTRNQRIFFPNAESASSTARSAVRLCSSITGLTSTISKLVMRLWSAMISMARCASR